MCNKHLEFTINDDRLHVGKSDNFRSTYNHVLVKYSQPSCTSNLLTKINKISLSFMCLKKEVALDFRFKSTYIFISLSLLYRPSKIAQKHQLQSMYKNWRSYRYIFVIFTC